MSRVVPCLLGVSIMLTLSGCSVPSWFSSDAQAAVEEPTVEEPAPVEEPTVEEPPPVSIANDLENGQTERTIEAGDVVLEIDYWSDLRMDRWTHDAAKPLTMNVTASLSGDGEESLYLRRVRVTPSVIGPDGSTNTILDPFMDEAGVEPGFVVKDPYSYSRTFLLPAVEESAVAIVLHIDYELLRQSTPTSDEYVQQTGTDSLTIALSSD
ncbi:hypothetical protein [Bogoriella caseilytica]|uniref:Lipoprotein LpqN n=1 Tax=Bogoriella caseilytica TaxID=56055 RepID=A0A3N2BC03_9MICO|nr:hypothetical protein [Bogoriella caseilytica]ROR72604.1 hypothetical protein EDD31_0960 [Bogoriella caseilytica]